jgi:hypothetical protein
VCGLALPQHITGRPLKRHRGACSEAWTKRYQAAFRDGRRRALYAPIVAEVSYEPLVGDLAPEAIDAIATAALKAGRKHLTEADIWARRT